MLYKVGDKVVIKPWELMAEQYQVVKNKIYFSDNCYDNDNIQNAVKGTDRVVIVCGVQSLEEYVWYHVRKGDEYYTIHEYHILGYAFKYGEKIEVSNDEQDWLIATFRGYVQGATYSIACRCKRDGTYYSVQLYKYAKPLPKKIELTKKQIADKSGIDAEQLLVIKE